jgi:hypothetical protein
MSDTPYRKQRILFELLWFCLVAGLLTMIALPIWMAEIPFPFWGKLLVFVLLLLTATRYTFFLRHSWIASKQWIKAGLFVVGIWGVFLLINALHDFRVFVDEVGLETILDHLPEPDHQRMYRYINSVMMFFGVASILSTLMLMIRLLISVWRWHNYKTV